MAQKSDKSQGFDSKLPLLIGITGHRDLIAEELPDLKKRFSSVIGNLQKQYCSTSIMIISALADGADRLAAEVALEMGLRLIVPLPMPQDLYEKDFSETSVQQFRNILKRADFELTLPMEPGNSIESVQVEGVARDRQYHAVGRFIVEHSLILIAFWDGVTAGPMGGTSQVIRMQLEGVDDVSSNDNHDMFAPLQTGPVIHLMTRRLGCSSTPDADYISHYLSNRENMERVNFLYPRNDDDTASREDQEIRTTACIERFNRDSIEIFKLAPDFDAKRQQSAGYVLKTTSKEAQGSYSQEDLSPPVAQLLSYFAHADALAQQFQLATYKALFRIPCLIPFIVFFLGVFSNVTASTFVLIGYLASIALAYGVFIITQRKGANEKFLDYRALAEGMRVALFWRLAGIKENPASFYLSNQQSELDWIRYALRTWNLLAFKGNEENATPRSIMAVKKYWLKDQMCWFGRKSRENNQTANKHDSIAIFLFRMGLFVMTPAMLVIHGLKLGGESQLDPWMMVITPLFFVVAGSINFYSYRMLFSEHAKQYARMYGIFKKTLDFLQKADDEIHQQKIILAVGKEALAENGEWVLIHRARPLEVPQG